VNFAATNGLTSIFAVKSAPPIQATTPGVREMPGGIRNSSAGYALKK
jgi:hypothetical protein